MSTFTNLTRVVYKAAVDISRELTGMVNAIDADFSPEPAAEDQTMRLPVTAALSAEDVTPAATSSSGSDITPSYVDVTMSNLRKATFRATPEQEKGLENSLESAMDFYSKQIMEGARVLINEVEEDLCQLYTSAATAYGTAGTTPFGATNKLLEAARARSILNRRGAPRGGRTMVIDSDAAVNLGALVQLTNVNEAGGDAFLRDGQLDARIQRIHGFDIFEGGAIQSHTAGTGSGNDVSNTGGLAVGDVSVVTNGHTGAGAYLLGDVLTFGTGNTSAKYVIASDDPATETITLNGGVLDTVAKDVIILREASYTANMFLHRSAIKLAMRMPQFTSQPEQVVPMIDPVSGLPFAVARYAQYHQYTYEVVALWGVKVVKADWLGILIG